ncbi:MAG: thioredoxin family protein [Bacteroidetes bacterium]|nr:thioredoxin family protein [Bacteroidota bacterium]
MKQLLFIIVFLMLGTAAAVQAQGEKVLTGPIAIADLLDLPNWFGEEYLKYQPDRRYLDRIPQFLTDVDVVCVLGTWCSDSRREVPRMIRIFQSQNLPPEKLQLIGVDHQKRSPNGEAAQYDVERVPTFIFIRKGKEIGRIVEAPLASLEKDMLGIIDPDAGKGEVIPPPPPPPNADDGAVIIDEAGQVQPRHPSDVEPGHEDPARPRHDADMQTK